MNLLHKLGPLKDFCLSFSFLPLSFSPFFPSSSLFLSLFCYLSLSFSFSLSPSLVHYFHYFLFLCFSSPWFSMKKMKRSGPLECSVLPSPLLSLTCILSPNMTPSFLLPPADWQSEDLELPAELKPIITATFCCVLRLIAELLTYEPSQDFPLGLQVWNGLIVSALHFFFYLKAVILSC